METRRLGRTEHHSSVAILGAAAFWQSTPEATATAFAAALDAGVNHLDIAPRYGDAQRLVGPLVPAVRDRLFVGCKTMRKAADGVRAQFEDSLRLLGCDFFDLYQAHAVTSLRDLDERAPAFDAILRARDEGLCRFVGITGHGLEAPAAHEEALLRYDLDTVMFPVNPRLWGDAMYRRDAESLLERCAERDVGVMAIKAAAARPKSADTAATTWYEPYTTADEVARGLRFALSTEGVHAICTPGDVDVLRTALEAANAYRPMLEDERDEAVAAVAGEQPIFPMPV